jgi:hypothetical protein
MLPWVEDFMNMEVWMNMYIIHVYVKLKASLAHTNCNERLDSYQKINRVIV